MSALSRVLTYIRIRAGLVMGILLACFSISPVPAVSPTPPEEPLIRVWMPVILGNSSVSQTPTPPKAEPSSLPAFPGAEGYGATTPGGRGGQVIEVTNLHDSGTGSLRSCVETSGPRICVFRIGGTIELQSRLEIENPYLIIAGQTAPGGGITLKSSPSNQKGLVTIKPEAHDVVIRYIRSRPGPGAPANVLDAFTVHSHHVVFDHVSASWAVDENLSTWYSTAHDVTFQWSIISEGLHDSVHLEGESHSKGMLLGSDDARGFSVHHNLFAHNDDRHPDIKPGTAGIVDIVNNVIYNYGSRISRVSDSTGIPFINYVGNYIKPGPNSWQNSSSDIHYGLRYSDSTGQGARIYVQGNIGPNRPDETYAEDAVVKPADRQFVVPSRHPAPEVTTYTALDAYDAVLADVGANKGLDSQGNFYFRPDAVDKRIVEQVKRGEGKIIDCPSAATLPDCSDKNYVALSDYTRYGIDDPIDLHGWPILDPGTPYADVDHDGMADEWEQINFGTLTRGSATDSSGDFDGDGYTDLEEFLNGTDPLVEQ